MTVAALPLPKQRRRVRPYVVVETIVLGLVVAFLILGRAGFVPSPVSYVVVAGHSMEPTLWTGDVAVLVKHHVYRKGQVIGYEVPKGGPGAGLIIIHRIIGGNPREGYIMQGDNKDHPDPWRPRPADVVGAEAVMVPKVGLSIRYIRSPIGFAALAGVMTLTIALGGGGVDEERRKRRTGAPEPQRLPDAVADLPHADELPEWFVRLRSGSL